MTEAQRIVADLADADALELVKRLSLALAADVSRQQLLDAAVPEARSVATVDAKTAARQAGSAESMRVVRALLGALAADPATAPALVATWREIEEDDSLVVVETIIAVGLLANLTLLVATTGVKAKIKGVQIEKKAADADMVRAVLEPLKALLGLQPPPAAG